MNQKTPKMGFEHTPEQQTQLGDCLWDLHAAGAKILEFTTNRSFEDFAQSEPLRSVVQAMLAIISGRLTTIRDHFPQEFARLDDAPRLLTLDISDDNKLWRAVEEIIPELVAQSRTLLDQWHQG